MVTGLKALINPIRPEPNIISLPRSARTPPDETAGRWTNGFAFKPYNNSPAWLTARCDQQTEDIPGMSPPAGLAVATSQGSGTLGTVGSPTNYGYKVTATDSNGETLPSAEQQVTVPSQSGSATAKNTLTWSAVNLAVGYNVYGRTAGGAWLKMTPTALTVTTFVDNGSVTPSGAIPSTNTTAGGGAFTTPAEVDWFPYVYHHSDFCSTIGYGSHDFKDRALTQLSVATQKAVELEFWAGAKAQANGDPNLYLIKSGLATDITPTSVPSRQRGFELLEQGLADGQGGLGNGARGYIHCRPEELPELSSVLRRDGNVLLTQRDTIVVAGSGYPNIGPIGNANATPPAGQAWMFATSMVEYREDSPVWYPDPDDPSEVYQAIDKNVNSINYRVGKFAAAYWDGTVTLAIRVTTDA